MAEPASSEENGSDIRLEQLLGEVHWVRGLASYLLEDEHLVDDVVQQTFMAWMKSPPRDATRLRPWLRQVVRNFVRLNLRERSRRRRREEVAAREDLVPEGESACELGELRQEIAEAILALDEPYRSTVVQHFYQELSAREIARREGVPPNTVLVRLRRAMQRLRHRLDHCYNGRRKHWQVGLMMLATPGVEVVLGLSAAQAAEPASGMESAHSSASTKASMAAPGRDHVSVNVATGTGRRLTYTLGALLLVGLGAMFMVVGPFSSSANPLPDTTATSERAAVTSSGGVVAAVSPVPASIVPASAGVADTAAGERADQVRIEVVDGETGSPVEGAEISFGAFDLASEHISDGRDALEFLMLPYDGGIVGLSDAHGVLAVDRARLGRDRLRVLAPGFVEYREDVRNRLLGPVYRVELTPAPLVTVKLVDTEGQPVPGAIVRIEGSHGLRASGESDTDGSFQFTYDETFLCVSIEAEGYASVNRLAESPEQTIRLDPGEPRSGRVVDALGQPVVGCEVLTLSPPRWRGRPHRAVTDADGRFETQAVAAGQSLKLEARHDDHLFVRASFGPDASLMDITLPAGAFVSGEVRATGVALEEAVVTLIPATPRFVSRELPRTGVDEEGRFHLGPVPPGDHTLLVEHPDLAPHEEPIRDLQVGDETFVRAVLERGMEITGQVVDPDGRPAAGVRLQLGRILGDEIRGPIETSGPDGRFRFANVPRELPAVRHRRSDLRWKALVPEGEKELPPAGLLLEVMRPHDLVSADGREIPRYGLLGSRNTVAVDPTSRTLELVVGPTAEEPPLTVSLRDEKGAPVRVMTNLVIVPPGDPDDVSVMFAGNTGKPRMVYDVRALDGHLIGFWTRQYCIPYTLLRIPAEGAHREIILEPRRPVEIHLHDERGEPLAGKAIFAGPLSDGEPFAAIYLGQTADDGRLVVDWLSAGSYRFYTPQPGASLEKAVEKRTARGVDELRVLGVGEVPTGVGGWVELTGGG